MLGCGGYIKVPLAIYSFKISFWMVPRRSERLIPLLSAIAITKANKIAAVELMVIDIDILSRGIPSNKESISSIQLIGTPTFPTSPSDKKSSES